MRRDATHKMHLHFLISFWRRRGPLLSGLLGLGLLGCSTTEPHVPRRGSGALKIGTYNVFVGTPDPRDTAAVIRRMGADLVVLQEVLPESAAILNRELASSYPHRFFEGGLGIVSRLPMRGARFERSRRGLNGFLFAEIEFHHERIQIVDLHLDPLRTWTLQGKLLLPLQFARQATTHRAELAQVLPQLHPGRPTILLGDFNRASDAAIECLKSAGYIDSFAEVTPHPDRAKTLRFSVLGFQMGKRIDFVFHDRCFDTIESKVVPGSPSDHDALVSLLTRTVEVP